jgi:hypothetical protein
MSLMVQSRHGVNVYFWRRPFLGISAYGGKANLPIIRLDL